MTKTHHLRLLGYRKSGQPIYLARGGAPTRHRQPTLIDEEITRHRGTVLEVAELEDPSDEDLTRQEEALNAIPDLEVERSDAEAYFDEIERVRGLAEDGPENTEPGDQRETPAIQRRRERGAPEIMRQVDPFEILRSSTVANNMTPVELGRALQDSNLKAMESFEMPKGYDGSFEGYIKRHGHGRGAADKAQERLAWSRQLLMRQRDDYIGAFEKLMVGDTISLTDVERAAIAVGTNTAGGYLVPTHLDPTLILTNAGAKDVVRTMSRVVTLVGGANKWNGVSTAGSTASWDGELTEVSDDTPPFAPIQIPVFSAKSLIQASIESFEDITGLASDVQMLLQDSRVRLETIAHLTGNGTTQPCGIFTALDANTNVEMSLTTGHTWTRADLGRVVNALGDRWTDGAEWLMHPIFMEEILELGTALGASYSVDLTQGYVEQLLSHKANRSFSAPSTSQTTTVDNLLVFGEFSNFVIVDKPGSTAIEFIPHLFNTSNNLPDGRRAWYMHFRNGSDSVNDLAFRLLQDKTTL
jgi:HK97 family phage major capsid protein